MALVLAAGVLLCAAAPAVAASRVTVAVMPRGTTVAQLARVPALALGVMSAGIGSVPAQQTYLDVSQGNRVATSLYDDPLAQLRPLGTQVPGWEKVVRRAHDVPASLEPGLLASTLIAHGVPARAAPAAGAAAPIAADRRGVVRRGPGGPGLTVTAGSVASLRGMVSRLRGEDLLIAFVEPPPPQHGTLAIGIAGAGFGGEVTSESTRTDGYVLSTDLAPTILRRFGVPAPGEMNGEPIRGAGTRDPGAISARAARMSAIPARRAPVLIGCVASWILLGLAVSRIVFGLRRVAIAWMALCFAYLPLMLLVGAWLEPGAVAEGLLVGFGAASLAAVTARFAWGWRGLAIACGATVIAYSIDVIAGSHLTALSLLGPNPVYGARFYGIGNELEALLAVIVPVGVGAGLTAAGEGRTATGEGIGTTRRVGVAAFLATGFGAAIIFGIGRFGADFGAAIVLPVGAVVAATTLPRPGSRALPRHGGGSSSKRILGRRRRIIAALIVTPLIAVFVVALIDLASGGNAHLTRSVLDAGGAGEVADAAQRRLELNAHDFAKAATDPLFWLLIAGVGFSIRQRRRIDALLRPVPSARAALVGACAAVIAGTIANDSGAAFLALGAVAIGAFLAFAWAQRGPEIAPPPTGTRNLRETRVMRGKAAGR